MSTRTKRAAIYSRLSYSRTDTQAEATLDRQEKACRDLAKAKGYDVVKTYSDVESAFHTERKRPGYEALVADVEAGLIDVVIVWRSDRLYRRSRQLHEIIDGWGKRVTFATVQSGDLDLGTSDGWLRASIMADVAEHESRVKGERVKARIAQRATQELRHASGGRRPFGWAKVEGERGYVIDPVEAEALAEVYRRIARGDSLHSVTRWLNESHTTPAGQPFARSTMRSMLASPRHAGLVSHHGVIVGPAADGQAVIDQATWHRVQAILTDPTRVRAPRSRTLLAGMARCTGCGSTLLASTKATKQGDRVPTMRCPSCGWTRRRALVEPLVVAAVGAYLTKHRERLLVAPKRQADDPTQDLAEVDADLAALDGALASGAMRLDGYQRAQAALLTRRDALLVRMTAAAGRPATAALVALDDPASAWQHLVESDLDAARALLREIVEAVEVSRSAQASPEDVSITWRV